MTARLGSALVLIGLIMLIVFLIMFSAGTSDMFLLLGAALVSTLGLLLRRRAARLDRHEAQRFRTLRHLLEAHPPDDEHDAPTS